MAIANKRNRYHDCYVPATTLPQRTSSPDLRAEAAAACELSRSLAEDPEVAVRNMLDIARDLSGAGSAGLSLLRQGPTGEAIIRWEAVSGALSDHEASDAPLDSTPCGLCVDTGIAILISKPQRVFGPLTDGPPVVTEVLIIPLYDGVRTPLGTLWAAHHDSNAHFDSNDLRILEQLAAQLVLALKLQEQIRDHASALAVFESHQRAQQNLLSYDLYEERSMREQAEMESRQAVRFKDALIDEMNHRTKNTLQVASNLLTMQARASSTEQVREALREGAVRLHVLASVHELLYANSDRTQSVFMPQLLQSLAEALRQSFGRACPHVALEIACEPMALPTQEAVALALLTNEAITNAYKHAFADESAGRIEVELQRTRENAISLRIEDTGSGVVPPRVEGMGLTLIRTFAAQLGGVLAVTRRSVGSGTSITLSIAAPVVQPSRL